MRSVLVAAGASGLTVVAFVLITRAGAVLAGHPAYAVVIGVLALLSAVAVGLGLRRPTQP